MGEPESADEAEALDALRRLLPDDPLCHAWTNLAFQDRTGHVNEVDVLLLVKQGMFVVELKGWHGHVVGRNNDWHVGRGNQRRNLRGNPVFQTDKKAKRLKGMLHEAEDEVRTRVTIPYIAPLVIMHGRRSEIELNDQTKGSVFGLDRFDVKGVPSFTELLKRPAKGPTLDKPTTDALVRLLQNSGLAPRAPSGRDEVTDGVPSPSDAAASGTDDARIDGPASHAGLFDELTDAQLAQLGVSSGDLPLVRVAPDIESLIGRIPDDVWDDLEAVAGGDLIDDVWERRGLALARFSAVAEQADMMGWIPEPVAGLATPEVEDLPAANPPPDVPSETELERQLRTVFGDRVTSPTTAHRKESKKSAHPVPPAKQPPEPALPDGVVPAETLLTIARTEALAGRVSAARALHDIVRGRLETDEKVDWPLADLVVLAEKLRQFTLLSHRLEQMVEDLRSGEPRAPRIYSGPEVEIGRVWTGHELGPTYSLLIRVPDILDRRSGVFLSQVIGPAAAKSVNERLRVGRPDGGRIRIVEDGTVVSRRDASSPWFVVGHVSVDEWFPAELVLAA